MMTVNSVLGTEIVNDGAVGNLASFTQLNDLTTANLLPNEKSKSRKPRIYPEKSAHNSKVA